MTPVLHAMAVTLFLCTIALSFPTNANNDVENNGIAKSPELLLSSKKMNKLSSIVIVSYYQLSCFQHYNTDIFRVGQ